jgi:hypothetical protein
MRGYGRWNEGEEGMGAALERSAITRIEKQVRQEFAEELSTGEPVPDRVLRDMRRVTDRLLTIAKEDSGVHHWRQLGWWRDPFDPRRVVMYC